MCVSYKFKHSFVEKINVVKVWKSMVTVWNAEPVWAITVFTAPFMVLKLVFCICVMYAVQLY